MGIKKYKLHQSHTTCTSFLDPDLNKPSIRKKFWDVQVRLNTDWVLNDIEVLVLALLFEIMIL